MSLFGRDPYATHNQFLKLPPSRRQEFRLDTDASYWRFVDCRTAAEYGDCVKYVEGDVIQVPTTGADAEDPEAIEALLIRKGYRWFRIPESKPEHKAWLIPPEQPCLTSWEVPHRLPIYKPPVLRVVNGDHRGYDGIQRTHTSVESWMDHLHTHSDRLVGAVTSAAGPAPGTPIPTTNTEEG